MNHLIDWTDVPESVWQRCLDGALAHGENRVTVSDQFRGQNLGLLFFNDSLRTRVSMELAMQELGGRTVTVTPGSGTWGFEWSDDAPMTGAEAEHIREAIGVLGRYVHALGVRLFATGTDFMADRTDARIRQLAKISDVPIINLESAWAHPCQALADAAVLRRQFGADLKGRRFVLSWAHHPKALPMAVPNSTVLMAARMGMNVTVARPDGFALDDQVMNQARALAASAGGEISESTDQSAALEGADVVYAKSWGGMGRYADAGSGKDSEHARRAHNTDWRVTTDHMASMNDGRFMHCLPVRRGVVVDAHVLSYPGALHLEQAEYRLHAQKAILEYVFGGVDA